VFDIDMADVHDDVTVSPGDLGVWGATEWVIERGVLPVDPAALMLMRWMRDG
jgi:hypothetical protein